MKSLLPENVGKSPRQTRSKGLLSNKFRRRQFRHPWYDDKDPTSDKWIEREPKEAYYWAKEQWLQGNVSQKEICDKLGTTLWRVRKWIYGPLKNKKSAATTKHCWYYIRMERDKKIEAKRVQSEVDTLNKLKANLTAGAHAIAKTITDLLTDDDNNDEDARKWRKLIIKNPRILGDLVTAMQKVDQVCRLEAEKPTQIVHGQVKLTQKAVLLQLIKSDPLIDYSKLLKEIEEDETKLIN